MACSRSCELTNTVTEPGASARNPAIKPPVADAEIPSACKRLTITAASFHQVFTLDEAGAAGDGVSVSPSVSIAIAKDQTTAKLGTGGGAVVTGSAAISATSELDSFLTSDAEAGGPSVAVGAAVAVSVITTITIAELLRSITADAVGVTATTRAASGATAFSSAKGESDGGKSGDDQANDQVDNNPNSSGKTDDGGATPGSVVPSGSALS